MVQNPANQFSLLGIHVIYILNSNKVLYFLRVRIPTATPSFCGGDVATEFGNIIETLSCTACTGKFVFETGLVIAEQCFGPILRC